MGKKVISTIYVDEEILKKAKEVGFNVSKICENCLKNAIKRMEGSNDLNNLKNYSENTQKPLVRGTGLEPAQACANRS